jgi:hypothetical protein
MLVEKSVKSILVLALFLYLLYVSVLMVTKRPLPKLISNIVEHPMGRLLFVVVVVLFGITTDTKVFRSRMLNSILNFKLVAALVAISYVMTLVHSNNHMMKEQFLHMKKEKEEEQTRAVMEEAESVKKQLPNTRDEPTQLLQHQYETSFNPKPYRDDEPLIGISDQELPPNGVNFMSQPPGPYADSGTAYSMGLN